MNVAKYNRIDVFNELVKPKGTFDYIKCEKLLGDNYSNFVGFCHAIDLIPEEIVSMNVVSFNETSNVTFAIKLVDGREIRLEA